MQRVFSASVLATFTLTTGLLAQSYDWRQSPLTGRLYATTQPMTWLQARAQANALGGELATVRSAAEQDWLVGQFGGAQCLWIGYSDAAVEGTWVWASGSTATYTNWAPGQPDNAGGAENWAALSPVGSWPLADGGRWLDLSATFACPGIVELDFGAAGRAVALGAGCPGSNGVPALSPIGGAPVPGSQFPVRFDNLPLGPTLVLTALGLPRPAPLSLAPFGMPGCEWYVDNLVLSFVNQPLGTGTVNWSFAVQSSPVLRGVVLRLQAAVTDPAANLAGITVTNALSMVYGVGLGEITFAETFADELMLDRDLSGGTWDSGSATFAPIGGNGLHGSFAAPVFGSPLGNIGGLDTFLIDTDETFVPATRTLTGQTILVNDGRYLLDEMVVPANVRLRFTGQSPPVFTVAGRIEILGEIDVQGESLPYPASTTGPLGQAGGAGGVFGGAGGKGGNKADGVAAALGYQGEDGESAHVLAGRAYASTTAATGGRGSIQFPLNGQSSALYFGATGVGVFYSPSASAGGGGGGLWQPGQSGRVVFNDHPDPATNLPPLLSEMGPPAFGGAAVQFLPFPPATGSTRSSVHFLVGGSGGGAAASNAALTLSLARSWAAGAGGGGGGGAVALRAGHSLTTVAQASIRANGGSAGSVTATFGTAAPAPGGGGSGGSVVLQAAASASIAGLVDVRGGQGGDYDRRAGGLPPAGAHVIIRGGDGSPGFVRLETAAGASTAMLPNMLPAPVAVNVGQLTEADQLASATSRFYDTGVRVAVAPAPTFRRYEVEATVDGVPMLFSDDPAVSTMTASVGAPVQLWLQGRDPAQPGLQFPWRSTVRTLGGATGLDADPVPAFRFRIVADRGLASSIVVTQVRVVYEL